MSIYEVMDRCVKLWSIRESVTTIKPLKVLQAEKI